MKEMKRMFVQIDLKKQKLDAKRPLPKHTVQSMREKLFLEWTYCWLSTNYYSSRKSFSLLQCT